jgi:hypothetical protein
MLCLCHIQFHIQVTAADAEPLRAAVTAQGERLREVKERAKADPALKGEVQAEVARLGEAKAKLAAVSASLLL